MRCAMGSSSSSSPKSSSDTEELHVLAVDDSVIDRKFIEKLLRNSAYKVTTVESGTRALEILGLGEQGSSPTTEDLKVNLIITDYCMPGMNGYELLKRVKECSAMREIPVVIMSSENIPTRIYRCLEGGAQEFMLKPLNQSDVKRLRGLATKFKKGCKGMFSGGSGR